MTDNDHDPHAPLSPEEEEALLEQYKDVLEGFVVARQPRPGRPWHQAVFALDRAIKGVRDFKDLNASAFRNTVLKWYRLAKENAEKASPEKRMALPSFEECWGKFVTSWPKVEKPDISLHEIANNVRADYDHPIYHELGYESEAMRILIGLCEELQKLQGEEPFFLACGTAGKHAGVSQQTAHKLLGTLVADGVLEEVEKGRPNYATRYRFLKGARDGGGQHLVGHMLEEGSG